MPLTMMQEETPDRTKDGCSCPAANKGHVKPSLSWWGSLKNHRRQSLAGLELL